MDKEVNRNCLYSCCIQCILSFSSDQKPLNCCEGLFVLCFVLVWCDVVYCTKVVFGFAMIYKLEKLVNSMICLLFMYMFIYMFCWLLHSGK